MAYISQIKLGNTTYDIKAKALASDILAANDAMIYKGTLPANYSSTVTSYYTPAANCGWTYKVSNVCNINGIYCEVGDMFICTKDNTAAATSSNYSTIMANWTVVQTNLTSAVVAATGTSASHLAKFTGATTIANATVKYDKTTGVSVAGIPNTYTITHTSTALSGAKTGAGTTGSTSLTPAGTISSAKATSDADTNYTPAGTISIPEFTGTAVTLKPTASYTPAGSVTINKTTGSAVNKFTASVSGTTLVLSASSDVTPLTNATGSFSGTPVTITSSVNYTPDGEISKPQFTGTRAKFTFTGTAAGHTHSIPSLSVSGNYDKATSVTTNGTKSVNGTLSHTATEVAIS